MKKALLPLAVFILIVSFAACGDNQKDSTGNEQTTQTSEQVDTETSNTEQDLAWPQEFDDWGIPTIDSANVVLVEDKSVSGDMITQGVNIIVNLADLSMKDFDAYCGELEKNEFVKSEDSMEGVMLFYNKTVEGGVIEITLTYSEDTTTIVANNSAAAAQSPEGAGGSPEWPDSAKGIPVFAKGSFKETIEMGGGMYGITYTGVDESDLDWYRNELKKAGFESQENEDTEGYAKMDKNMAYSVGFIYDSGMLQIIVMSSSY
ncbi:MAG: hypothetical protein EOM51_09560 [Clostridia bacterium]|nr:hypothetical protein [Clostridia bacterium]